MNILLLILTLNSAVFIDNQKARDEYNKGYNYFINNDYTKALTYFNKTINIESDAYEVYFLRAIANSKLGNHLDAIKDYTTIKDVKYMKRHLIYNNRGLEFLKTNQSNKAIQDFTKAINIKNDFAMAYNNRGHQFEENGDFKNALKDYYSAIEYDNSNDKSIYLYNAARLESVVGNKNYAVILIEEALEISPNFELANKLKEKIENKFANLIKN